MTNSFYMRLCEIQPSQLYVSEDKLKRVQEWFSPDAIHNNEALPIKELKGVVFFTDGHTRALASCLCGMEKVKVYWDKDDLDWDAYLECIQWCVNEGITQIKDLENRIIPHEQYESLWIKRCQQMYERLECERGLINR